LVIGKGEALRALSGQAADRQASVVKRVDLSIIVCTKNRRDAVTACLDSIAASMSSGSGLAKEIVVVDNASQPMIIVG